MVDYLSNSLSGKMGKRMEIKRLLPRCDIEIRDIDPSVDDTDVLNAITDYVKTDATDVNIRSIRETDMGMKLAIVEIPMALVRNINEPLKVKIGWTSCRMKILPRLLRCYNCHGFGHMAGKCTYGENRSLCRRCGIEGHKLRDCTATPKCLLCSAKGKAANLVVHIAGSTRCPEYREALNKASYPRRK